MKKAISLLIVLSVILMSLTGITITGNASDGTDPITYNGVTYTPIDSAADFSAIKDNLAGNYAITKDITLDQTVESTHENYYALITEAFAGTLIGLNADGTAEEIRTVTVNTTNGLGMFRQTGAATLKNIKLAGTITGSTDDITAGMVGDAAASTLNFVNCHNTASISGGKWVGGLFGYVNATRHINFTNCSNTASISGGQYAAGLASSTKGQVKFDSCFNSGDITGTQNVGGLIAYDNNTVSINNSYNSGNLKTTHTTTNNIGGLVCICNSAVTITASYNAGAFITTVASPVIGQLVNKSTSTTYTSCYYLAETTDTESAENTPKGLSETDMKNEGSFDGFTFNDETGWKFTGTYEFPQLATNPHPVEVAKIETPVVTLSYNEASDNYTISWNEIEDETLKDYTLTVKNTDSDVVATEEGITGNSYTVPFDLMNVIYNAELVANSEYEGYSSEACAFVLNTSFASLEEPYILKNKRHFQNIQNAPSASYKLVSDISLDQTLETNPYVPFDFSGTLIGADSEGNEELRTINVNSTNGAGLFESVSGVEISNIRITGSVSGSDDSGYTGGFTSVSSGASFVNCHNEAVISGGGRTGGLVGSTSGGTLNFTNCSNTGSVSGGARTGGIVGHIQGHTITKCFNSGSVSGSQNVGGIIGYSSNIATITSSYNSGTLAATSDTVNNIGGLIGYCNNSESVSISYNAGSFNTFAAAPVTGQIIGGVASGITVTVSNCYYLADATDVTTVENTPKGLSDTDMKIKESFDGFDFTSVWTMNEANAASIKYYYPQLQDNIYTPVIDMGDGSSGRPYLIYTVADYEEVIKNATSSDVYFKLMENLTLGSAEESYVPVAFTGNFDGNNKTVTYYINTEATTPQGLFSSVGESSKINNLNVAGEINADSANYIGGIAGDSARNAAFNNNTNYVNINVNGDGKSYTGGIVGYTNVNIEVNSCKNYGNIDGNYYCGGIIGCLYSGASTVKNCENYGWVKNGTYIGGISGKIKRGTVENCINYGALSGSERVGGIFAWIEDSATVTGCINYGVAEMMDLTGGYAGGIVSFKADNTNTSTISGCYNLGPVFSAGEYVMTQIAPSSTALTIDTVNPSYYLAFDESYDDSIEGTTALAKEKMTEKLPLASEFYLIEVNENENGKITCEGKKFYARKGSNIKFTVTEVGDYTDVSLSSGEEELDVTKENYTEFSSVYTVKEADAVITVTLEIPEFGINTLKVYDDEINSNELIYFEKGIAAAASKAENAELVFAEFEGGLSTADEYGFVFSKDETFDESDAFIPVSSRQGGVLFHGADINATYYVAGYIVSEGVKTICDDTITFSLRNIK